MLVPLEVGKGSPDYHAPNGVRYEGDLLEVLLGALLQDPIHELHGQPVPHLTYIVLTPHTLIALRREYQDVFVTASQFDCILPESKIIVTSLEAMHEDIQMKTSLIVMMGKK